ncbi:retrovirus-related pol polyprotein from transposon TNT 1-94 [Tanacetum coccineum]
MGTFRETLTEGTEGAPHLGPERPRVYSDLSPEDKERNQATIHDGRVVVPNVQGRQNRGQGNNARGGGAAGYGGAQNRVGNANPGQARQIKCYNCNGEWGGIGRDLALNVDNEFQANNCDAFDSDVDEAPTTQTMFMANLLSVDLVYDEADLSYDSEIRLAMIVCVVGAASSSRLHLASLCGACLARGHQGMFCVFGLFRVGQCLTKSLEELLAKHQEESARRSTKMEIEQLTKELRSRKEKSEQAKVVIIEHEGPNSPKKIKNLHIISFLSDSQEENTNDQLPTKESNPGHFTLPCTIGNFNFYAMANLVASVNVLLRNIFEYLELTNLSEIEMLVEMADMRKRAPLGIVRDILVKIDKFLFLSDFVILDQTPNSTIILGRPFLATIHTQISVFEKEISVEIGDERVTFNINRNDPNFTPIEGIFMLNSINTDEPITKRLKISDDTATTHFYKTIIQECDKDFKAWPSCSLFRNKCDGRHEIYRINELVRYGSCQVEDSVWSKRYSEWCNENSHDKKPRPRDNTFKEWVKLKKGHLDISKSVRKDLFRSWVIDQFTEVSSYEVLEGFWRGDVAAARKEQQGGDVASLVAKERNRGACKLLGCLLGES